jgi:RNase P subunit RPR2
MATIRKRGSSWQVQIRQPGQPSLTRSFKSKSDAIAWGRQTEAEIDRRGLLPSRTSLDYQTVGELLRRYRDEIVVHKRGAKAERYLIHFLLKHKISAYSLANATPDIFREFRDDRLREVSGGTVRRQLAVLQHAFNVAIREWSIPLYSNPVTSSQSGVVFICPHCGKRIRVPRGRVGQVQCLSCGHLLEADSRIYRYTERSGGSVISPCLHCHRSVRLPVWSHGPVCGERVSSHHSVDKPQIVGWEKIPHSYRYIELRDQVMPCVPLCRIIEPDYSAEQRQPLDLDTNQRTF